MLTGVTPKVINSILIWEMENVFNVHSLHSLLMDLIFTFFSSSSLDFSIFFLLLFLFFNSYNLFYFAYFLNLIALYSFCQVLKTSESSSDFVSAFLVEVMKIAWNWLTLNQSLELMCMSCMMILVSKVLNKKGKPNIPRHLNFHHSEFIISFAFFFYFHNSMKFPSNLNTQIHWEIFVSISFYVKKRLIS